MGDPIDVAIPILPSRDIDATAAFYGRLGFATVALYPNQYLILRRQGVELHFFPWPDLDPATSIAAAYIRLSSLDSWHADFEAAALPRTGIPRLTGIEDDLSYGLREFALVDPDGNLIRCGFRFRSRGSRSG